MIDRRNQKQMTVTMSHDLAEKVMEIVEQDEEMSEARFAREAMRREAQRYEKEGYDD